MSKGIICAACNRNAFLMQTLPTWLSLPFDKIVITDWGNRHCEKVSDILPVDNRIILVEVLNEPVWIQTQPTNLAFAFCNCDVVYKMDTDYSLHKDFIDKHPIEGNSDYFWAGDWNGSEDDVDLLSLTGASIVPHKAFTQVNGFNENILTYGYDDDDLYYRLVDAGYQRRKIDYSSLHHLHHSDKLRGYASDEERRRLIDQSIETANRGWDKSKGVTWSTSKISNRHFRCKRV